MRRRLWAGSPERTNRRNGYRSRKFDTRAGTIGLAIPKLRTGSYFSEWLLERRKRAERALASMVATCYLLGVSTRRMDRLVQSLGITTLSKSQVSEMAKELDAHVRNTSADGSILLSRLRKVPSPQPLAPDQAKSLVRLFNRIDARVSEIIEEGIAERLYLWRGKVPRLSNEATGMVRRVSQRYVPITSQIQTDLIRLARDELRPAVDLVVVVDQEVTVRHGKCPLDAVGREDIELGEPIGGFAKLHHQ